MIECSEHSSKAEWDERTKLEKIICSHDPGHNRGGNRSDPLGIVLSDKAPTDFVWTWYSDCLIQDHVLAEFKNQKVSGYNVKPVRARYRSGMKAFPPKLWEFVTTGWSGVASPRSGVKIRLKCPYCELLLYSGYKTSKNLIDINQWDGSDIFMVWPYPRYIFITEKVAKIIKSNNYTGVDVVNVIDLSKSDNDIVSPGRLRKWMPDKRAHELGDPLGIY